MQNCNPCSFWSNLKFSGKKNCVVGTVVTLGLAAGALALYIKDEIAWAGALTMCCTAFALGTGISTYYDRNPQGRTQEREETPTRAITSSA